MIPGLLRPGARVRATRWETLGLRIRLRAGFSAAARLVLVVAPIETALDPPAKNLTLARRKSRAKLNPSPFLTAENGDKDPKTGQFRPGNRGGPGRPRGIDIKTLVTSRVTNLDEILLRVLERLAEMAIAGDVQAAKLLFDRVCMKEGVQV